MRKPPMICACCWRSRIFDLSTVLYKPNEQGHPPKGVALLFIWRSEKD